MLWKPGLTLTKDPVSEIIYCLKYESLIGEDTLSTVVINATGVSVLPGDITISGNSAKVLVTGGTLGESADIDITATTTSTSEVFNNRIKFKLVDL